MRPDLAATRQSLLAGNGRATDEIEAALDIAQSPACQHAFLRIDADGARRQAADPANQAKPLAGLAFPIRALFDMADKATPAGSKVLADAPPATHDCPAVARLKAAGAAL